MKNLGLYIHIPFCEHKCIYCNFYSVITKSKLKAYCSALQNEIEYYAGYYSNDYQVGSIFIGGGTPSIVAPAYMDTLLKDIRRLFNVTNDVEITIEANPGTLAAEKLSELKNIGINRLSIGVQSFNDDELRTLTRIHDRRLAEDSVIDAYKAGFENINIDLIFNIPGQIDVSWRSTLDKAVNLPVTHISAYSLTVEPGTILYKRVQSGLINLPAGDTDADLYTTGIEFFEDHGFMQYEVSNYAKPGYECRHNLTYWNYSDYLGLGTSSHSFINGRRSWNYSSLTYYLKAVEEKGSAVCGSEVITGRTKMNEVVMLSLRTGGLDKAAFMDEFGTQWFDRNEALLDLLKKRGHIIESKEKIKLTRSGYALSDEIIGRLT